MQSFLPLPQSATGVFQNLIELKYASGKASTASVSVTAAAIPIVRSAIVRYALDSKIVR